MSDDVFNIPTPFADVAALGQGYAMRADGEYLWVPLPQPLEVGTPVQFVIMLADGTPAFAGLGQCVQVADSGEEVDPQVRFETALGALQFDERSQPVYEYLVAVRAAAEEAGGVEGEALAEGAEGEAVVEGVEGEAVVEGVEGEAVEAAEGDAEIAYDEEGGEAEEETPHTPSVIPTGILSRPAIALGWQPAPPRPPEPREGSGLFQYATGTLPVPEQPPRPELDPSLWVQPAARPNGAAVDVAEEPAMEAAVEETGEVAIEEPVVDGAGGGEEPVIEAAAEEMGDEGEEPVIEAADEGEEPVIEDAGEGEEPVIEAADEGEEPVIEDAGEEEPVIEAAAEDGDEAAGEPVVEEGDDAEEPVVSP